jgi:hypothetical protein
MRFGRWTTISKNYVPMHVTWKCHCDCGTIREVWDFSLIRGQSVSCGCFQKQRTIEVQTTHSMSKSKEYRKWLSMKQRCYNQKHTSYPNYGGRGIAVCDSWKNSFENFYADMGPCPSGLELDRIYVNGNYEPGNCRWATDSEQSNNKRKIVRTTCHAGHSVCPENTYTLSNGITGCLPCRRIRYKRWKEKKAA